MIRPALPDIRRHATFSGGGRRTLLSVDRGSLGDVFSVVRLSRGSYGFPVEGLCRFRRSAFRIACIDVSVPPGSPQALKVSDIIRHAFVLCLRGSRARSATASDSPAASYRRPRLAADAVCEATKLGNRSACVVDSASMVGGFWLARRSWRSLHAGIAASGSKNRGAEYGPDRDETQEQLRQAIMRSARLGTFIKFYRRASLGFHTSGQVRSRDLGSYFSFFLKAFTHSPKPSRRSVVAFPAHSVGAIRVHVRRACHVCVVGVSVPRYQLVRTI